MPATETPIQLEQMTPTMGAETGYGVEEQPQPIRPSGFIGLLLGVASALCLLGRPLLFLPILAIGFGLFALRPSGEWRPIGRGPAKLGMILASLFGACGFFMPWFAQRSVGDEAVYFAREYLHLIAQDDFEMALEMRKTPVDRLPKSLSLRQHYAEIRAQAKYNTEAEGPDIIDEYEGESVVLDLRERGADTEFKLINTPRLYERWQEPHVETVWQVVGKPLQYNIVVTMAYGLKAETNERTWYVKKTQYDEEQPVAERNF